MVISTHGHLIHKNVLSDKFIEYYANTFSKALNLPKETVYEKLLPQVWASNAEEHVKALDNAEIDKSLVMVVDWGMNPDIGEAKWSIEEMNKWVADEVEQYPDKLYALCAVDPRRVRRQSN